MSDIDEYTLRVPAELWARVEQRAADAGFASGAAYALYVLEEVTSDEDEGHEPDGAAGLSAQDEGDLVDRLRGLGYVE